MSQSSVQAKHLWTVWVHLAFALLHPDLMQKSCDSCVCACVHVHRFKMVMPQALAQVTFPVSLQWSLDHLEEANWLLYVCQLLEMCLIRLMRFEQSKVWATQLGCQLSSWRLACFGALH